MQAILPMGSNLQGGEILDNKEDNMQGGELSQSCVDSHCMQSYPFTLINRTESHSESINIPIHRLPPIGLRI